MKKMIYSTIIGLLSISLSILSVLAFTHLGHNHSESTWHATWHMRPTSLAEARKHAHTIVVAKVAKVAPGDDLVVPVQGEPNAEDRIPTQRITFQVVKTLKGIVRGSFTLFRTGSDTKSIEEDPPYKVGETHLLFLIARSDGTFRVIAPDGRFQLKNGALNAAAHEGFAPRLNGKRLDDVEQSFATE